MATAVYEQRSFTNSRTGEIIKYDWYGVQATVNGEYMELPLKNLDGAEKVAFKMISTGTAPANYTVKSGGTPDGEPTVTKNEVDDFFKQKESDDNKINLEEDD